MREIMDISHERRMLMCEWCRQRRYDVNVKGDFAPLPEGWGQVGMVGPVVYDFCSETCAKSYFARAIERAWGSSTD